MSQTDGKNGYSWDWCHRRMAKTDAPETDVTDGWQKRMSLIRMSPKRMTVTDVPETDGSDGWPLMFLSSLPHPPPPSTPPSPHHRLPCCCLFVVVFCFCFIIIFFHWILFDVALFCLGCCRAYLCSVLFLRVTFQAFYWAFFYSALVFSGSVGSSLQSSDPFTS